MLSLRYIKEFNAIELYGDEAGLTALLKAIETLRSVDKDHVHLRAPSGGGNDLKDSTPYGEKGISELIINFVDIGGRTTDQ